MTNLCELCLADLDYVINNGTRDIAKSRAIQLQSCLNETPSLHPIRPTRFQNSSI